MFGKVRRGSQIIKWERKADCQNNTIHKGFLFVAFTSSMTGHQSTCRYMSQREKVRIFDLFSGMVINYRSTRLKVEIN